MDIADLDTPCGFCESRGHREIPGGSWLSAPECPECGGSGYLITCTEAERLLAFLVRHIGPRLRERSEGGVRVRMLDLPILAYLNTLPIALLHEPLNLWTVFLISRRRHLTVVMRIRPLWQDRRSEISDEPERF